MTQNLDICFVSGASSPIGRAMVKVFTKHGYRTAFLAGSNDVTAALESSVPGSRGAVATDTASVRAALLQLVEEVGRPRVLVTCDDEFVHAAISDTSREMIDSLSSKVLAPRIEAIRTLVPYLADSGQGRIINVLHRDWLGWHQVSAYSFLNGGLLSLTRSLAWELAKQRVTVNAVVVGVVCAEDETEFHGKPLEKWLATQPIRKVARPEDVAEVAAFLASPRSGFITGQALYADGGRCIYSSLTA